MPDVDLTVPVKKRKPLKTARSRAEIVRTLTGLGSFILQIAILLKVY